MSCISPISLRDPHGERHVVPCGKCLLCLASKRADWTFRLLEELRYCTSAFFVTLTYAVDPIELDKSHLQLFFKRLRKFNSRKVRYYAVGEYGTKTLRPHYHAIVFGMDLMQMKDLTRLWNHGNVHVGNVTPASVAYVTKYVINRVGDFGLRAPPFALMSRRPGIGNQYLVTARSWHREDLRMYTVTEGRKRRLPRFYKDKIFSKMEKQLNTIRTQPKLLEDYLNELERLAVQGYADPAFVVAERERRNYELLFFGLNDKNKF